MNRRSFFKKATAASVGLAAGSTIAPSLIEEVAELKEARGLIPDVPPTHVKNPLEGLIVYQSGAGYYCFMSGEWVLL